MNKLRTSIHAMLAVMLLAATAIAQTTLTDPYEILKRHFNANGGLQRVKAERSQHVVGTLAVAGLKGTLEAWTQLPDYSRANVDLGILKSTQGDNGEYQWVVDQNGKVQKITKQDEATKKRREVKRYLAEYEYANPKSSIFKVVLDRIEKVDGKDCYVLKITNSINSDVYTSFINTETFMLEKATSITGEDRSESQYGDYRDVGSGLKVAFYTKETSLNSGQVQEITITQYDSNPAIDKAMFEPPTESAKDYRFTSGSSAQNIPFRFIGNHIFLYVIVGCKERLWVLDTGAGMSVISDAFAKELGLKLEGDLKGLGAAGTQVSLQLTKLPPYSLKGIDFDGQTVAVLDMKELNRTIGFECAGILGFDFLSRFVTKVDYDNQLLSFYEPETFTYVGDGVEVPMHLQGGVFMVEAALDGTHSGSWLFDMGATGTSLDEGYAIRNGFTKKRLVEGMGRGAGKAFKTASLKCQKMEFAGFTVDNPIVGFSMEGSDTTIRSDQTGALGNTLFRNFVIYCDYTHERLIVEKGDYFNQPFPRDNSGLQLVGLRDENLTVNFVSPGSPAAKSGLKEGDVLKSINGIAVQHFDGLTEIRKILAQSPGTVLTLGIEREGQKKEVKVTLADLYM